MNVSKQAVLPLEDNGGLRASVRIARLLALTIVGVIFFFDKDQSSMAAPPTASSLDSGQGTEVEGNDRPIVFETEAVVLEEPLKSFFPIDGVTRYTVPIAEDMSFDLTVASYVDNESEQRRAVVYLPSQKDDKGQFLNREEVPVQFRYERWVTASDAIEAYTESDSLFVSFWDNSQRIHLFTGRDTWVTLPAESAYKESERPLWQAIAGGFDRQGRSAKFGRLLLMDAAEALDELRKELPQGRDHYLLLGTDDLSHVEEIARMTGRGLPLETRLFPTDSDLHNRITQVKEWAQEGEGTGSYLAHANSERSIRVWRITDKRFEESLLARLLPFSTSLDSGIDGLKLVFQSDWGGYISIYQLLD